MRDAFTNIMLRASGVVLPCLLAACGTVALTTSPPPTMPVFQPIATDKPQLSLLNKELNTLASHCRQDCDQVHYYQALVGLFDSRQAARTAFQRVTAGASTPLGASSALWLKFLDDGGLPWTTN